MFGLFGKKDINEKIASLAEKGHLGKLLDIAQTNGEESVRVAAYKAIGNLHAKEAVDSLLAVFRTDETTDVKLAAAEALSRIATRSEFDAMFHAADNETDEAVAKALRDAAVEAKERQKY